jgi:hypothetical protein
MYVCVYVCMYVCMYVGLWMNLCLYAYVRVYVRAVCLYVCIILELYMIILMCIYRVSVSKCRQNKTETKSDVELPTPSLNMVTTQIFPFLRKSSPVRMRVCSSSVASHSPSVVQKLQPTWRKADCAQRLARFLPVTSAGTEYRRFTGLQCVETILLGAQDTMHGAPG